MAAHSGQRLREIVSDYYHGLLALESYREQRAELLDNLDTAAAEATARRQTPEIVSPEPAAKTASNGTRWPVLAAVGGAAVAGIAVVIFLFSGAPDDADSETFPSQPETLPAPVVSNTVDDLLVDFLSRSDWSDNNIAEFIAAWQALDPVQRDASRAGQSYRRLSAALNRRLREESALGTPQTDTRMVSLTGLAAALNIAYRESESVTGTGATLSNSAAVAQPLPETAPVADENSITSKPEPTASTESVGEIMQLPKAAIPMPQAEPEAERRPEPAQAIQPEPVADVQARVAQSQAEQPQVEQPQVEQPQVEQPQVEQSSESAVEINETSRNDTCLAGIAATRRPYCQDLLADSGEGPPLVVLPVGPFEMGGDFEDSELPRHRVNIEKPIAMSRYEITAAEFARFCQATDSSCPANSPDNDIPVVNVNWEDAVRYAEWLSNETGFNYRLPSEAEWEYAARAGTQTPYFFGDEITPSNAHSSVNGDVDAPLPRGNRMINRNPFRLFHMSGNVREWVQDSWYENYVGAPDDGSARIDVNHDRKVVRGGSYADSANKLRSASRESLASGHRDGVTGFRLVREVVK